VEFLSIIIAEIHCAVVPRDNVRWRSFPFLVFSYDSLNRGEKMSELCDCSESKKAAWLIMLNVLRCLFLLLD